MSRKNLEYVSKEYRAWVRMIHRCHNEDYEGYETYGGRGIAVCQRWRDSYHCFLMDMGRAPSPAHSIERQDNNGPYTPTNCVWATKVEQANNRRTNVTITHRGLTLTMAQWARFIGVSRKVLWKRFKLGWTNDRALAPWPAQLGEEPRRAA